MVGCKAIKAVLVAFLRTENYVRAWVCHLQQPKEKFPVTPAACVRRRRTSKLKSSNCCWRALESSQKGFTCITCLDCMPLSPSAGIFACNLHT